MKRVAKCIVCKKSGAKPRYRTVLQGFIAEGRAPLLCDECSDKEEKGELIINFKDNE